MQGKYLVIFLLLGITLCCAEQAPNILMIVADDYGWSDVGYHASDLKTPNIDALAAKGIKLENYYVQPVCTPTRAALMTGRYPMRYGRQHTPIAAPQPTGLFLNETILPQVLRANGYATHAIGKWHLGMFQWDYVPTYRGFDTHYGFWNGDETYFTHDGTAPQNSSYRGYDFRSQKEVLKSVNGSYSSHLFANEAIRLARAHNKSQPLFMYVAMQTCHLPLQAPQEYLDRCDFIKTGQKRKTYCAMTLTLDEAVKNITDAFEQTGLMNNTLVIFTTDNGGLPDGSGYNWPLRGGKGTYFEGGVRGVSFVYGPMLKKSGTHNYNLMHATDWFPTILDAANIRHKSPLPFDGISNWNALNSDAPAPRDTLLINVNPTAVPVPSSAIRIGDWKLIQGSQGYDDWYQPPQTSDKGVTGLWLFNITADPEERTNLADKYPSVVQHLQSVINKYSEQQVMPWNPDYDPKSNPSNFGGIWTPWM